MLKLLKYIFEQDQKDRREFIDAGNDKELGKNMVKRDAKRLQVVSYLFEKGFINKPQEKYYAALIFHHGVEIENSKIAKRLAKEAWDGGYEPAENLFKAATDRLLIRQGEPQRYGTQKILAS